jgi:hypothetical protein
MKEQYENIQKIKTLYFNNKETKIDIEYNVLEQKITFIGKAKILEISKYSNWNVYAIRSYSFKDTNKVFNFEEICKDLYHDIENNKTRLVLINTYLQNTDYLEIENNGDKN